MNLTRKENDLLTYLMANAGRVVQRARLLTEVWGYSPAARTRTLDVHIRRLRRKFGHDLNIETVFGVGYRFQPLSRTRMEDSPWNNESSRLLPSPVPSASPAISRSLTAMG